MKTIIFKEKGLNKKKGVESIYLFSGTKKIISNFLETILLSGSFMIMTS
jgi:hypothetical protein